MIFPLSNPVAPPGHHIIVIKGSLATDSAVLKLSGKEFNKPFSGPVSSIWITSMYIHFEWCLILRQECLMVKMELMMPLWEEKFV